MIRSFASWVPMCFFENFSETSVSGMALSYRGFGFPLKKLMFEVSSG